MTATTHKDAPVVLEGNGVELRRQEIGPDLSAAFVRLPAGADMGPALKGLPDDMCPCPHWGYLFKGRLKMHRTEGAEIYEAGQAFYWAPGHAPEALEDCEYVDFSPTTQFKEVLDHVKAHMG